MTDVEQSDDITRGEKRSISDLEICGSPSNTEQTSLENDDNYKKAMHRASEQRRRQKLNKGLSDLEQIILNTRKFRTSKDHIKLDKISLIENTISYIRELETYYNALSQKSFVSSSLQTTGMYPSYYQNPVNQSSKNFEYIDVDSNVYPSGMSDSQMNIPPFSNIPPKMMYPQYPMPYNNYFNPPMMSPSSIPPQMNSWYYNQYLSSHGMPSPSVPSFSNPIPSLSPLQNTSTSRYPESGSIATMYNNHSNSPLYHGISGSIPDTSRSTSTTSNASSIPPVPISTSKSTIQMKTVPQHTTTPIAPSTKTMSHEETISDPMSTLPSTISSKVDTPEIPATNTSIIDTTNAVSSNISASTNINTTLAVTTEQTNLPDDSDTTVSEEKHPVEI